MSLVRLASIGVMVSPFATDALLARRVISRIARDQSTRYSADGVTGALIIDGTIIIEVLEGAREAVTDAFLRSAAEPLRTSLMLLGIEDTRKRLYREFEFAELSTLLPLRPNSIDQWTVADAFRVASLVTNDLAIVALEEAVAA